MKQTDNTVVLITYANTMGENLARLEADFRTKAFTVACTDETGTQIIFNQE